MVAIPSGVYWLQKMNTIQHFGRNVDVVEERNLQSGQDANLMKLPDYLLESQSIETLSSGLYQHSQEKGKKEYTGQKYALS